MSLDGAVPTFFTFHDDLQCYNFPLGLQGCFNYTTYNAQSLSYGSHVLDITLFTPSNATLFPYSDYFLDYVAINDTNPNPPPPVAPVQNITSFNVVPTQTSTDSNPTAISVPERLNRNT
jgi:hypothetical protein